eukprot:TRINITY_DN5543_c0_g1_i1.p1 TRINITY_DN5543_c0_g1~~TRINITY_DN5543_c0_g1_i1.p1  ORF type:complete len:319 (-),score=87.14 TRINITY_DN5543_c0_g1_i1:71-1027(-)
MASKIVVVDPHVHYWDVNENSPSGHKIEMLGECGKKFPVFLPDDDIKSEQTLIEIGKMVHVEALSSNPVQETNWVHSLRERKGFPQAIVGYCDFDRDQNLVEEELKLHSKFETLRGIRQILNFHPTDPSLTWPKVKHGNYFKESQWRNGLSLLEKYSLSFDLHVNPHQIKEAAEFFKNFPNIPVCLNHIGCLHLTDKQSPEEREKQKEIWREGMKAISSLGHASVKISYFPFVIEGWEKDPKKEEELKAIVKEVIDFFGPERSMFASNFPVDKVLCASQAFSIDEYWKRMLELLPETKKDSDAIHQLFNLSASKFYRL